MKRRWDNAGSEQVHRSLCEVGRNEEKDVKRKELITGEQKG